MEDYRAGRREPAQTSRGRAYHDTFACRAGARDVRVRATGRNTECVRDETSGIGLGSSGCRDGVGTGRGMSHNTQPGYISCAFRMNGPGYIHSPSQWAGQEISRAFRAHGLGYIHSPSQWASREISCAFRAYGPGHMHNSEHNIVTIWVRVRHFKMA